MNPETHEARLQWLAEQEKDCHHDKVLAWDVPEGIANCEDCGGSSKVARFSTLRQVCSCKGRRDFVRIRVLDPDLPVGKGGAEVLATDAPCPDCQGRGWQVVDSLEATLAAARQGGYRLVIDSEGEARCSHRNRHIYIVKVPDRFNEAAILALFKARQKEVANANEGGR